MLDTQCDITDLVDIIQEKLETWETEGSNPKYLSVSNSSENKVTEKDKIIHKNIKEEPLDSDINDMNHEDIPKLFPESFDKSNKLITEETRKVRAEGSMMIQSQGKDETFCYECNKVFKAVSSYKRHMRDCHSNTSQQFQCDLCDKVFQTKGVLVNQKSAKHKEYGLRWSKLK